MQHVFPTVGPLHLSFLLFGSLIPALLPYFDLATSFFFFSYLNFVITSLGGLPLTSLTSAFSLLSVLAALQPLLCAVFCRIL